MSARKFAAILAVLCAAALLAPVAAGAQAPPTGTSVTTLNNVPVTGTARNHKAFKGHYSVTRFVTRHSKTYALGTLTGKVGKRHVSRSNVAIPVTTGSSGSQTSAAAACPILHLTLGPVDLNLLGLQVHLNQVVLDITAQSGPGNLLGNLLCSVAGLLDNGGLPVGQITGLLNILNSLLNQPGLLNL